jgi:hypothetical protein
MPLCPVQQWLLGLLDFRVTILIHDFALIFPTVLKMCEAAGV